MIVLGLNIKHADSSACLIKNGRLLSAVEEERFTKIKHSSDFPLHSINFCLESNNIRLEDIDYVTVNNNIYYNLFYKILYFSKNLFNLQLWINIFTTSKFSKNAFLKKHFANKIKKKIIYVSHHLSHLFSTFFFLEKHQKTLIYSFDGSGDFSTFEIYLINGHKYHRIEKNFFPHSLGILYTAFTQFLGFREYGDEYKVMGLSGYGKPIYLNKINKLIKNKDPFKLNLNYFNIPNIKFSESSSETYAATPKVNILFNEKFINLFGKPRDMKLKYIDQIYKDYANSLQKLFEDIVLAQLKKNFYKFKVDKLILTGGCAFNSLLIKRIHELNIFKNIVINTNPGDAGGAIGSAFYFLHKNKLEIKPVQEEMFLGPSYSNKYVENNLIKQLVDKENYRIKYYKNFNNLISKSAQILREKKIIFWFQGKMEWGPRALGNRSILADPTIVNIKNLINLKIKNREKFRPFALTILEDSAENYFHMNKQKSPNMNIVFKAKKITKEKFPGVVHVDGTSRIQTINRLNNYKFYKLIKEFQKKTNCPMLINTSLNINAPIALSPHDAFIYFLSSGVETIVINNWIIELKK